MIHPAMRRLRAAGPMASGTAAPRRGRGSALALRAGFSLVELMVATTLSLVVIAAAVPFFRGQLRALSGDAARFEAVQTGRFASDAIDRDLRAIGLNLADNQPPLVEAHPLAITFNSDLVTLDSTDENALAYDPSTDSLSSYTLPNTRQVTLPLVARAYPDSTYTSSGALGRAETVSYWAAADSTAGVPGRYVLYRRVNDRQPTVLARNIALATGQAIFHFYTIDTTGALVEIPGTRLPLVHTAPLHGVASDTGASATIDSIRVIRMYVPVAEGRGVVHGDTIQVIDHRTRLGNAMLAAGGGGCGMAPAGAAVSAQSQQGGQVTLSWSPSADDTGGQRNVERYIIYRRANNASVFGEPYASVAAGASTYTYIDRGVSSGQNWVYGLVAQNCGGVNSTLSTTNPVNVK